MPVPAVSEWEWLNWKFPRAVHAGDTIYARWTLTQKRAAVGDDPTAVVVWRVDVHTAAGALCAEGEVGASVLRKIAAKAPPVRSEEPVAATAATAATSTTSAPRRRRRRRPATGEGAKSPAEPKAVVAVEAAAAPPGGPAAERPPGGPRRRRRRRSPGSAQARNGDGTAGGGSAEVPSPATVQAAPALAPAGASSPNPLTRAIRRLRRP
jgi:hypothetical protein